MYRLFQRSSVLGWTYKNCISQNVVDWWNFGEHCRYSGWSCICHILQQWLLSM